jgi:hypothetical protein
MVLVTSLSASRTAAFNSFKASFTVQLLSAL